MRMNRLHLNLLGVCLEAVRTHAKGDDVTDQEITAAIQRTIPGTIKAVCDACASGKWTPPPLKSRAAKLEAKRAKLRELAAPVAAVVPPKTKTGK